MQYSLPSANQVQAHPKDTSLESKSRQLGYNPYPNWSVVSEYPMLQNYTNNIWAGHDVSGRPPNPNELQGQTGGQMGLPQFLQMILSQRNQQPPPTWSNLIY
jgi:hypothetical protein